MLNTKTTFKSGLKGRDPLVALLRNIYRKFVIQTHPVLIPAQCNSWVPSFWTMFVYGFVYVLTGTLITVIVFHLMRIEAIFFT